MTTGVTGAPTVETTEDSRAPVVGESNEMESAERGSVMIVRVGSVVMTGVMIVRVVSGVMRVSGVRSPVIVTVTGVGDLPTVRTVPTGVTSVVMIVRVGSVAMTGVMIVRVGSGAMTGVMIVPVVSGVMRVSGVRSPVIVTVTGVGDLPTVRTVPTGVTSAVMIVRVGSGAMTGVMIVRVGSGAMTGVMIVRVGSGVMRVSGVRSPVIVTVTGVGDLPTVRTVPTGVTSAVMTVTDVVPRGAGATTATAVSEGTAVVEPAIAPVGPAVTAGAEKTIVGKRGGTGSLCVVFPSPMTSRARRSTVTYVRS
ncbi:hypothetical protein FNQ90_12375 [Streptomyces alkaliphilus]|uniref:Uncharacterized protein n=1 Tax=Streptomyces alkaliphilus TaxID=1472722 RepID=A0A7W3TDL0_9ACTN|nr:hypothetical protein [Streptomyces alkaliphilus]MBB0244881.1 hypothetical protein [Streptomyces alkaliphilus]